MESPIWMKNATVKTISLEDGLYKNNSPGVPANLSPLRPSAVVAISPLVVMLVVVLAPFICWCGFQCQKENRCCRNTAGFEDWTTTTHRHQHGRNSRRGSHRTASYRERNTNSTFPVDSPYRNNAQLNTAAILSHNHIQVSSGRRNGLTAAHDTAQIFDDFAEGMFDKPPTYEEALNVPDVMEPPPSYEEAQRAEACPDDVLKAVIIHNGPSSTS